MPTSEALFSVPATVGWSVGPLAVRGDDVYAVLGLIAGVALLTVWVVLEHLRKTRRSHDQPNDSYTAGPDPLLEPTEPAQDMPSAIPVPARTEWLLDDNTLVRTQAVRRGSPIPPGQPVQPVQPVQSDQSAQGRSTRTPPPATPMQTPEPG